MNKTLKTIIAGVLCANLITITAIAGDLENKKQESSNIKQEISNDKEKINELKNTKKDILNEIEDINNNIKFLDEEVDGLNFKINKASGTITELEKKSEELQKDLEKNKEVMSKRFRTLYMNKGQGYIEIIFQSKSLGDFIERVEIISTLIKYDNEVVDKFKKNQNELDSTLKEITIEKESLESNRTTVQAKADELSKKKSEKDMLMAKAEEDIASQEKIIAQKEEEFQQIVAIISDMEKSQRPSRGDSGNSQGGQVSNGNIYSITGGVAYPITSGYGWRTSPITGKSEFQAAVDIGAPQGASVYSLMDGTVAYSGWMNGYGNVVVINHGSVSSLYAHNSKILVSKGQAVKGGQKISLVGSTGWSTGPHIHFEVTNSSGQKIDPTPYYIY